MGDGGLGFGLDIYPVGGIESYGFDFDEHVVWGTFGDRGIVDDASVFGAEALEGFHCFGDGGCCRHLE